MPDNELESGSIRLCRRLRQLRHAQRLTQEELAERANMLDPSVTVSVDTVRALERVSDPRPLPARQAARGRFALEVIVFALGVDLAELLIECFNEREVRESAFSGLLEERRKEGVHTEQCLREFVDYLPRTAGELLELPGLLKLKNSTAFAYILRLSGGSMTSKCSL